MTRDEAINMVNAYAKVVASHFDEDVEGIDDDGEAWNALISALTAPPEKPRVDVRKVWRAIHSAKGYCPTVHELADALRAAGVEVVE